MPDHDSIDQRSLAFGRLIATRIKERPELIAGARDVLRRWRADCAPGVRATLDEWQAILDGGPDDVIALLVGRDERAVRLRQSNPFTGALSPSERNAILRQFQSHDAPAA